jgi:hypothetical protein
MSSHRQASPPSLLCVRSQIFSTARRNSSWTSAIALLALIFIATHRDGVEGHGYMIDPPSRSSVWRLFPGQAPPNYNDNELFCGGFSVHDL